MSDKMVQEVQQWLNDTYPSYFKYDESGTNNGSYPVKPVDGIWGNATSKACATIQTGTTDKTIIRIAQGGFYCKGYNPNGFDGLFGSGMENAIQTYKTHLGIPSNKILEPEVFKSLLTTDTTVLTPTGKPSIRIIQQYLNKNYYSLFKAKLGYIPTGGNYDRKTSTALIYAVQKEIGTTADGQLGPNTFKLFPSISIGCTNMNLVKLLQASLICNSSYATFDGIYSGNLASAVEAFQKFMCLDTDPQVELGKVNRRTWGALLWSKGDTDRKPNACDCSVKITSESVAQALYNEGFRYIGRYLTDPGVSSVVLNYNFDSYNAPYPKELPYKSAEEPILNILPSIRRLEDIFYNNFMEKEAEQKPVECAKAVLDYLYQYQYDEYKWDFISPQNTAFINFVNKNYSNDESITKLHDYIYTYKDESGNHRVKLLSDKGLGEFELPHLAVVIKCYIQSLVPGSWSAWAGDFATSVKEVYVNLHDNVSEYVTFAESRIGDMEPPIAEDSDSRQFNYCDIIADLDGYAIRELMKNSSSKYILSECISSYYSDSILPHFTSAPKMIFASKADDYPYAAEAAAIALAENILFWSKYTSVI